MSPAVLPDLPPVPFIAVVEATSPAEPVIVARKMREKGATRVVAAAFWPEGDAFHPLFVFETGEVQCWDAARDEWHRFASRRAFQKPNLARVAAVSLQCKIVATGFESGQIRLQRLESRGEGGAGKCHTIEIIEAHRGGVLSMSAAKNRLFSAGSDGAVVMSILPDASNSQSSAGKTAQVILDGLSALSALAVSPDGRYLSLGADDGQVQMWQLGEDSAPIRLEWTSRKDISPVKSRVKSLKFSPNGHMLLSRNAQGEECLWAAQSGHRLPFPAPKNSPISAAFASDSRLLARAGASGEICLFDAWAGELRHTLAPIEGEVQALEFSPPNENEAPDTLLIVAGAREIVAWQVSF